MKVVAIPEMALSQINYNKPYALISIASSRASAPKLLKDKSRIATLKLIFSDIDIGRINFRYKWIKEYKLKLFSKLQAKLIVDFILANKDIVDLFVVNCEAGISRSPAVALAILYICEEDAASYYKRYDLYNRFVYTTIINEYINRRIYV
jgi:predicted protein tyrosine phosphatase